MRERPMSLRNAVVAEDAALVAAELEPTLRPLSGTTLLVTGGSGFLCSYFLEVVARLNDTAWSVPCRMLCLDNLRSGVAARVAHLSDRDDFELVRHDVAEPFDRREPIEWIIHGASVASPVFYRRYPLETIAANVDGTRQMLALARRTGARGLLYLSTSEVYGDPEPHWIPTPEEYRGSVSCTGPRACYDESKRLAETLCMIHHRKFAVPVNIVRPFNVYGPGQPLDDGRIIPDLMSAAVHRTPIVLRSDGRATRAFCYISDVIRAMLHVLMSGVRGEIFNVGNDREEMSIREVAERLSELAGPPALPVQYVASDDADYVTDNPRRRCPQLKKIREAFGWEPRVSLTAGLQRTLASYQAQEQPMPEAARV
jgi:dTDP-glucose 4,6-dehydratase